MTRSECAAFPLNRHTICSTIAATALLPATAPSGRRIAITGFVATTLPQGRIDPAVEALLAQPGGIVAEWVDATVDQA